MLLGTQVELTAVAIDNNPVPGSPGDVIIGPLTAEITDPTPEFSSSINGPFTADFTDTTLKVSFVPAGFVVSDTFTFQGSAFAELTLTEVSNSFDSIFFPGQKTASATLVGDTLTFGLVLSSLSGSATYFFAPEAAVPEPSSLAMLSLGGLGLFFYRIRRRPTSA